MRNLFSPMAQFLFILTLLYPGSLWASPWTLWEDYMGRRAYDHGQWVQAEKNFKQVLASDPRAEDYYNLGATQYRQGNFEEARKNFNAASSGEDPSLKEKSFYNLGNAYFRQNQLEASISAYEKALQIDPKDTQAELNLQFVKKKLEEQKQPETQPQQDQQGQGEKQGEGQSQEGEKKETADQKQKPEGDTGEGKQEQQPEGKQGEERQEGENQQQGQNQNEEQQAQNEAPQPPEAAKGQEDPPKQEAEQTPQSPASQDDSAKQGSQGTRAQTEEPKDLEGNLEPSGEQPPGPQGKQKEGLERAEISPEGKEAQRWLEMIEDKSQEIREQMIQGAMGRSRTPEKDW